MRRLPAFLAWLTMPAATFAALFPTQLKKDEVVVFFSTFAAETPTGWSAPIHGWVYEPEEDSVLRKATLALFRKALGITDSEETEYLRQRAMAFLRDSERGKAIRIRLGNRIEEMPETGPNGHFEGSVSLSRAEASTLLKRSEDGWISFSVVTSPGDPRLFPGRFRPVPREGLSVISDLDDTVKVSNVADRSELLANTFLRPFQAVPGMAEKYRQWAKAGAEVHYVTASPWQLYGDLAQFLREAGFPQGSFHMKLVRFKDSTVLDLVTSPEAYKRDAIEAILRAFPERRFVLVGDSGEKDPEAYGALAREHPKQVDRIFIRDVTGEAPETDRYRAAFEGVPDGRWKVFRTPGDLPDQ